MRRVDDVVHGERRERPEAVGLPHAVGGDDDRGVGVDGADGPGSGALEVEEGVRRWAELLRLVHEVVAVDAPVTLEARGDALPDLDEVRGEALLVQHPVFAARVAIAGALVEVHHDALPVLFRPREDAVF